MGFRAPGILQVLLRWGGLGCGAVLGGVWHQPRRDGWDLGSGIWDSAPGSILPAHPSAATLTSFQGFCFFPTLQDDKEKGGDLLQETRTAGRGWRTTGRARGRRGEGFVEGDSGMGQSRRPRCPQTPPPVPADPTAPLSHRAPQFPALLPIPAQSSHSVLGEPLERPGHLRVPTVSPPSILSPFSSS